MKKWFLFYFALFSLNCIAGSQIIYVSIPDNDHIQQEIRKYYEKVEKQCNRESNRPECIIGEDTIDTDSIPLNHSLARVDTWYIVSESDPKFTKYKALIQHDQLLRVSPDVLNDQDKKIKQKIHAIREELKQDLVEFETYIEDFLKQTSSTGKGIDNCAAGGASESLDSVIDFFSNPQTRGYISDSLEQHISRRNLLDRISGIGIDTPIGGVNLSWVPRGHSVAVDFPDGSVLVFNMEERDNSIDWMVALGSSHLHNSILLTDLINYAGNRFDNRFTLAPTYLELYDECLAKEIAKLLEYFSNFQSIQLDGIGGLTSIGEYCYYETETRIVRVVRTYTTLIIRRNPDGTTTVTTTLHDAVTRQPINFEVEKCNSF